MQTSAEHHFIPQALLRHFCFKGETLSYYTKEAPAKGIQERNIKSVFKKRHFNTYRNDDGTVNDALEQFYASNFDNEIAKVIPQFERLRIPNRTSNESINKPFVVQFFYNHMRRTPELTKGMDIEQKLVEITREGLIKFGIKELTADDLFTPEQRWRVAQNARVEAMGHQSERILDALNGLKLTFAFPERSKKSFIIGSNPILRFTNDGDTNVLTGEVELWTALTPDIVIGLVRKGFDGQVYVLNGQLIRKMSLQLFKQSMSVAAKSPALLRSIVEHR